MNYPPNTRLWSRGDFVLHDADAKTARMIMVVEGVDPQQPDDHIVTRYADPAIDKMIYVNHYEALHDPRIFDIDLSTVEDLWPHAKMREGSRVATRREPTRKGRILSIEGARTPPAPHMRQHYGRARILWSVECDLTGRYDSISWVYLDQLLLVG